MNSLNLLDIVKDLQCVADFCGTRDGEAQARHRLTQQNALPGGAKPEYSSGVSSSMEIDANYGTAESSWENPFARGSAQLPRGPAGLAAAEPGVALPWGNAADAISGLVENGSMSLWDELLRQSNASDLMKIQVRPDSGGVVAHASAPGAMEPVPGTATSQSNADLASYSLLPPLDRQSSLEEKFICGEVELPFDAPLLGQYDSRDSVQSAPDQVEDNSYDSKSDSKDFSPPSTRPALGRSQSVVPETACLKLTMAGRSQSVTLSGQFGNKHANRAGSKLRGGARARAYSEAGPGTNRPPKEGSQSAMLPKDKLSRKRAAARRYYHNQKNKVIDYEEAIARLQLENTNLAQELALAVEKLEMLRKAHGVI